ncbi:MAG: hypothetical protein COC19_04245 [SAR86 cluster bacterium]|uniref:Uncharacterized protein n=1 Tax=SAR86 cluster bacterium TaxID=2030880 RepID=A0A2A4MQ98_9GAMM|nr:MAG: hypothetical protein COC19_04245 [SAR86 cluster bacterium]
MVKHRNWVREEVWAALVLYLKTEFGRIHKGNPEIIALSQKIYRTPSSVALKMSNLAALDQTLDRKYQHDESFVEILKESKSKNDQNRNQHLIPMEQRGIWSTKN